MKAKVIETREIVNVTPYPTWYQENGQGPDRREWDEDELEFIYSNKKEEKLDLEKEIQEAQRNYKTIEEYKGYPCTMYADDIEWIARHFFELGLKAKGE